ncbi:MAG: hypothetical protein KTR29_24125 [Rhodothermaceae bacterium]|nr:hypothetical protein [Rhodothermaceae bacterium]
MRITFTKKNSRTQLACQRADGSAVIASLGPQTPYHDLGHFVVERKLRIKKGFFGYVEEGYSIEDLSKKEVILTLDAEAWQSEILTRALGSLATGACTIEQFPDLVNSELKQFNWPTVNSLTSECIEEMYHEFKQLILKFNQLDEGESMALDFSVK